MQVLWGQTSAPLPGVSLLWAQGSCGGTVFRRGWALSSIPQPRVSFSMKTQWGQGEDLGRLAGPRGLGQAHPGVPAQACPRFLGPEGRREQWAGRREVWSDPDSRLSSWLRRPPQALYVPVLFHKTDNHSSANF